MIPEQLIREPKRKPGRRQTVTAHAHIGKKTRGGEFYSYVSMGRGVVYTRRTGTRHRKAALEFNRTHLLHMLRQETVAEWTACEETQEELFEKGAHT